jgi:hypothetical protein
MTTGDTSTTGDITTGDITTTGDTSTTGDITTGEGSLLDEIQLYQSVFKSHYSSLVMNLRIKETKGGERIWIDIQKCTVADLEDLLLDSEIQQLMEAKRAPYRDR